METNMQFHRHQAALSTGRLPMLHNTYLPVNIARLLYAPRVCSTERRDYTPHKDGSRQSSLERRHRDPPQSHGAFRIETRYHVRGNGRHFVFRLSLGPLRKPCRQQTKLNKCLIFLLGLASHLGMSLRLFVLLESFLLQKVAAMCLCLCLMPTVQGSGLELSGMILPEENTMVQRTACSISSAGSIFNARLPYVSAAIQQAARF
jgi:hypothetical protein